VLLVNLLQQVHLFRPGREEFAMHHFSSADVEQVNQLLRDFLASLSPEERLAGLSPEERLRGLSPEELERLRQLLQTKTKADNTSRPE
jgi:hypothetical protein